MEIRPLVRKDVDQVVSLWQVCELTRPWNDPFRDIELAAGKAASEVLVGVSEDRVVASCLVGFDGHRGWVYYVSVLPECRGRGFGRAIMEAAETWLIERGAPKIMLMVRASNRGVIEFYDRLGFKEDSTVLLGKFVT